jgi:hypothetical protein
MSKEEVQRKLEEIKRLYGGNAGPIVDVTVKQIEEEPDEEEDNGSQAGSEPVQKAERKPPKLPFHPD